MQQAIRTFIGRVLLVHLVLLAALLAVVYFAARAVYAKAREHALTQATQQQALLADQTAGAVQSFYDSILSDLQLLRPEDEPAAAPAVGPTPATQPALALHGPIGAPLLSRQLAGRLSHLFIVDRPHLRLRWVGIQPGDTPASPPGPTTSEVILRLGGWLRTLHDPTIDSFIQFGDDGFSVVAVPYGVMHNQVLVAVVPVKWMQTHFLDTVNRSSGTTLLLNANLTAMAAFEPDLVGANVTNVTDPEIKRVIAGLSPKGEPASATIAHPFRIGPVQYRPAIVTVQSMKVGDENWFILLTSPLANADRVVAELFHEAVRWCVFLVVSITALLASTAVQLIRGRLRLEHQRLEMVERELKQAREIQLAWLPPTPSPCPGNGHIDIATLNQPASHISGDFYNFFNLPDGRTVLSIGDVTGHGMAAAFLMATTQLLVRNTMPRVSSPAECLAEVNRQLCVQVFNGQFVTMQILVLDCAASKIEVATAGHPAPLLSSGKTFVPMPLDPQLVLGVEKETRYRSQVFPLEPNWSLLLYTDGIVEAERHTGERLGFARLQSALEGPYPTAQDLVNAAMQTVEEFRRGHALHDDLTLVAVQGPKPHEGSNGNGARST